LDSLLPRATKDLFAFANEMHQTTSVVCGKKKGSDWSDDVPTILYRQRMTSSSFPCIIHHRTRASKERIEQLLLIPLVQGTLQMAYRKDHEQDYEELAAAEGAAYAAAVLAWVHSCNVYDAETIHTQMWTGRRRTEFRAGKHALGTFWVGRREGKTM
jgi:hypothetical protein